MSSLTEDIMPGLALSGSQHEILTELQRPKIEEVARALMHEGACVTLSGEPDSDTVYIAQAAAQFVERLSGVPFEYVVIGAAEERISPAALETLTVRGELESLVGRFERGEGHAEVLVIALDVDRYDHDSTVLLERLVRARHVRLICTTHRITGAADRLARNPEVAQHVVAPLTLEQTGKLLARLFGVSKIAPELLNRWQTMTAGNQHAIVTLALSAERRGVVQRARRTAWIAHVDDEPPIDFIEQLGPLTPLERDVLDLISYAMPVQEPPLFRILDAATVNSLLARDILTVHTDHDGLSALQTRIPVVGEALRAHLSPFKRVELAERCFAALNSDEATLHLSAGSRRRLVKFGVESGNPLPIDWLWNAMRLSTRTGDLPFHLTLSLAAMTHPDPQRSAEAIVRSTTLAYLLGNHGALIESIDALNTLLSDVSRISQVAFETQADLVIMWVRCNPVIRANPAVAVDHYDEWEQRWIAQGFEPKYLIQSCRVRSLSFAGRVKDALVATEHIPEMRSLGDDWYSTSTRTFEALLRTQRGEFRTAIQLAENARQIMLLHDLAPTSFGDLEGFALFLAHWARGTTHSTRQSLYEYATSRQDVQAVHEQTRTIDLSIVLFAAQEGRWTEAAELIAPLVDQLTLNDPFGLLEFSQAAAALIYATLGERRKAYAALKLASSPAPGLSRMLYGFVGILSLRALHWLRDPAIKSQARALADWAARQELPLIELEALDIFASEVRAPVSHIVERATTLAGEVDQPIGETLLAHIRALTHAAPEGFMPEERLLSELGVWLPLPPAESLTGREREIALFTAVGYSSKQVGERLHLSARTVETHLAHVYSKLSITSREDLRNWFASIRDHRA